MPIMGGGGGGGGGTPFNGGTITNPLTITSGDGEGDPLDVEAVPSIGGSMFTVAEDGTITLKAQSAATGLGRIRLLASGGVAITAQGQGQDPITTLELDPIGSIGLGPTFNVGTTPNGFFFVEAVGVPADSEVPGGNMIVWFDATDGAAKLMVKAKTANGTVVTGSLALA